ncbi:MAG TPA: glycosyltransferase family 4 protein [Aeromicrobium sp.]|nr:glycosyltransferase family 4 protein [Aeromicrobium sp.]
MKPNEPRPDDTLRVAMLAKGWTGFLDTSFRRLAERNVDLFIAAPEAMPNTSYPEYRFDDYAASFRWSSTGNNRWPASQRDDLVARVRSFDPHAVLMHSWETPGYRAVVKATRGTALRVLWMDNVWLGNARQWAGRLASPFYLRPLFDAVMVPSDRTEFFARRLGFSAADVIRGAWSADTELFRTEPREGAELAGRRRFVSALRLVHHKGADVLAAAYNHYRQLSDDPWDLDVAGIGPLASSFDGLPGVHMHGFVAPPDLAELMRESSCYINPSRLEPYALVLHEAAASGLPILCGDVIGAAPTMVQDGQNGWIVPGGDERALAEAMHRVSGLSPDRLAGMSEISRKLASRLSPEGWARHLDDELRRRIDRMTD